MQGLCDAFDAMGMDWSRRAYEAALERGHADDPVLDTVVGCIRSLDTPDAELEFLQRQAVDALIARGVQPRRSRLTAIFVDLHQRAAAAHARRGEELLRVWNELLAADCGGTARDCSGAVIERTGTQLAADVAVVDIRRRVSQWTPASIPTVDDVRAHRLAGAHFEALTLAARTPEASWQAACCRMHLSADTGPIREWLAIAAPDAGECRGWAALYEHAAPKKFAPDRVDEVAPPTDLSTDLGAAVALLSQCRNQEIPMHVRLQKAGHHLRAVCSFGDAELTLVTLAGLARWLFQAKRRAMVQLVVAPYRDLSLRLSSGQSSDVLGFVTDIMNAPQSVSAPPPRVRMDGSWRGRAGDTAGMLWELASTLGVARTRKLFAASKRAKRLASHEREALLAVAARHVDGMKGPFLKMAQHLGAAGLELSPPLQEQLERLRDSSTPIAPETIKAVIATDLRAPISTLFAEFDEVPLGTGSIGQVHAARLHDGTEVAVKVRFPGIVEAIRHDFWHLGLLVPVAQVMRPKVPWRTLLNTLYASLQRECDLRAEADHQERFRRHFLRDSLIAVPRVHRNHCSDKVLTMDRVHGATLTQFAENASYQDRKAAAEAMLRLMFTYVDGRYTWSDPNPGNYLFDDDRLHIVDFGCVAQWEPGRRLSWLKLGQAMMNRDEAGLRQGIRDLGFAVDPLRFDYAEFVTKFHPDYYSGALDEGGVPLHSADVVVAQLAEFFSRKSSNFHNITLPPDLVLGLRAYYGTLFLLASLRIGIDSGSPTFRDAVNANVAAADTG